LDEIFLCQPGPNGSEGVFALDQATAETFGFPLGTGDRPKSAVHDHGRAVGERVEDFEHAGFLVAWPAPAYGFTAYPLIVD
jgi:hypothetical protein